MTRRPVPEAAPDRSVAALARLVLELIRQRGRPFRDWKPADLELPPAAESPFMLGVWMYQLYVFHLVTAARLGPEAAMRMLHHQRDALGKRRAGVGRQLEQYLGLIHGAHLRSTDHAVTIDAGGRTLKVPHEHAIAIALLASFRASDDVDAWGPPEEVGYLLVRCLQHGRESAERFFQEMYDLIAEHAGRCDRQDC